MQRGQPREAAQYFSAAVQAHPDYAPALLNLATVAQQHLRDNKLALQNYRAYLVLTPRPANWDEVNAIATSLQQPMAVAVVTAPPTVVTKPAPEPKPIPPAISETKTQAAQVATPIRPVVPPKLQTTAPRVNSNPPPKTTKPAEVVKVQPEPVIVARPSPSAEPSAEPPSVSEPEKTNSSGGLFSWLHSKVTPLPAASERPASVSTSTPPPRIVQPAPPAFPRYTYLSPGKPKAGDRVAASGAFTRGRELKKVRAGRTP